MKRLILLTVMMMALTAVAAVQHRVDDIPNVHVKDRTQYVANPDGVLSQATVDQLNAEIARVWDSSSAELAVVVVDDFDESMDPDTFATRLFEKWGIGKSDKDNGVLVLISSGRRRAVIRTGYGTEGVLPDIICGRIIRNEMAPYFREGDYDGGTLAAIGTISKALTDPVAAEELRSKYANDSAAAKAIDIDFFSLYLHSAVAVGVILLGVVLWLIASRGKRDDQQQYHRLEEIRTVALFVTVLFIFIPLPGLLLLLWQMRRIRNRKRRCPNCDAWMKKLDEATDNQYLTPVQDTEEQLNSVDYDVWLCPTCGETDIIPYVNRHSNYVECSHCHGHTCSLASNRVVQQPTTERKGAGVKSYLCNNCHKTTNIPYIIPMLAAPIVIAGVGGGGRGFGGGGGGFSGGSFGGGFTGGGGASGGW